MTVMPEPGPVECADPDAPVVPCAYCGADVHTCELPDDDPRVGGWQEQEVPLPVPVRADDRIQVRWWGRDADCCWLPAPNSWHSAVHRQAWPVGCSVPDASFRWRWVVYDGQSVTPYADATCPRHPSGICVDGGEYEDWPPGRHWFCGPPCRAAFIAEWRLEQAHKALDGLVVREQYDEDAGPGKGTPVSLDERIRTVVDARATPRTEPT